MNYDSIFSALDEEISRLQQARKLLSGGLPQPQSQPRSAHKKHRRTKAGLERIRAAQKARWAAQREAAAAK